MLVINTEQMNMLENSTANKFIERLISFLLSSSEFDWFTSTRSDKEFKQFIYLTVDLGSQYDFVSEKNIFKFVVTSIILGRNFDVIPKNSVLLNYLSDESIRPDDKWYYVKAFIDEIDAKEKSLAHWLVN